MRLRRNFAQLLALIMALVLCLTLAACGGGEPAGAGTGTGTGTGTSQQTAAPGDSGGEAPAETAPEDTPASADGQGTEALPEPEETETPSQDPGAGESTEEPGVPADPDVPEETEPDLPVYGDSYYDVENVVLYLEAYGELPPNFIRKNDARDLGWSGGSVEDYLEGAAIGGDRFGNYEGLLPEDAQYTECDIDTLGYGSRGARRLVFSDDGRYFYTDDHYESFRELWVTEDWQIQWEG